MSDAPPDIFLGDARLNLKAPGDRTNEVISKTCLSLHCQIAFSTRNEVLLRSNPCYRLGWFCTPEHSYLRRRSIRQASAAAMKLTRPGSGTAAKLMFPSV